VTGHPTSLRKEEEEEKEEDLFVFNDTIEQDIMGPSALYYKTRVMSLCVAYLLVDDISLHHVLMIDS